MFDKNKFILSDVIGRYITLKESGREFKGLCPFHQEKTPSFSVNNNKQLFKCFGCGASGDVYDFISKIEQVSLVEAKKILHGEDEDVIKFREKSVLERCMSYFIKQYSQSTEAQNYVNSRGILCNQHSYNYYIGYAPKSYSHIDMEISDDDRELTGLFNAHPIFLNRLVLPIYYDGDVIGFTARALDNNVSPKYLNSLGTKKSHFIYNLHTKPNDKVYVVEGVFDCIKMQQAGYNSASVLGASPSEQQLDLLIQKYKKIILTFDGDNAGKIGTFKTGKELLRKGIHCFVRILPDGYDPDKAISSKVMPDLYDISFLEYYFDHPDETIKEKLGYIMDCTIEMKIPVKHYVLTETAKYFGVNKEELFKEAEQTKKEYIEGQKKKTLKMSLLQAMENIGDKTPDEILNYINRENVSDDIKNAPLFRDMIKAVENSKFGLSNINVISTGYEKLDTMISGFRAGLYVLCGQPSMGKTSLAINIVHRMLMTGKKVLFVSLEMREEEIIERQLSIMTGIPNTNIRDGNILHKDLFRRACSILKEQHINLRFDCKLQDIELSTQMIDWDVLIIDYLQLIDPCMPRASKNDAVSHISRKLKQIANEHRKTVIALSQLNRVYATRDDKRPLLSDLRDSGAIEQDADLVMGIYRDGYYNKATPQELIELIIMKNRNGRIGKVDMFFDLITQNIWEVVI